VWVNVYAGSLLAAWVGLAVLLASGGLRREQLSRSSAFTLSLPAHRASFLLSQVAVGLSESVALAFTAALLIPTLGFLAGETFPLSQALQHALLLVGAGAALYGWAFLVSQMMPGPVDGVAISLGCIGAFFVLVKRLRVLDRFDIFDIMSGADLLDRNTFLLRGPLPWPSLAATAASLLLMVWLSVLVINRHDF